MSNGRLSAVMTTAYLTACKRGENQCHTGAQFQLALPLQAFEVYLTLKLVQRVLPLSTKVKLACYAVPVASLVGLRYEKSHRLSLSIVKNIGTLCHATAFIAAIEIARHGRYVEGGIIALSIAGDAFQRRHAKPLAAVKLIKYSILTLGLLHICKALVLGSWRTRGITLGAIVGISGAIALVPRLFRHFEQQHRAEVDKLFADHSDVAWVAGTRWDQARLSWDHIRSEHIHTLPPAPDISMGDLVNFAAPIELSEERVGRLLAEDDKWNEEFAGSGKDPVEYVREGLNEWISKVDEGDILEGKPSDFAYLNHLARLVAQQVIDEADKEQQSLALIEMGIAGHYCGDGLLRELRALYSIGTAGVEGLGLEPAIHKVLAKARKEQWEQFLNILPGTSIVEVRYFYQTTYAKEFGLEEYRAAKASSMGALTCPFMYDWGGAKMAPLFYQMCYTPSIAYEALRNAVDGEPHPTIEGRRINRQIKPALINQWLQESQIDPTLAFNGDGTLSDSSLIQLMLDHGVIHLVNPS